MNILIILSLITALLLWYALQGRDWLKSKPWPWVQKFFAWVEPIEIALFRKSSTILFARLKMVSGLLLTYLTMAGSIDLSPWMPFVPEKYQPFVNAAVNSIPLVLTLVGWADERLRKTTTKPIELVAVPDKVVAENPVVANAVAVAEAVKVEAVAKIEQAKAA